MFSDHITHEGVELLVAYLFTAPHPFQPPATPLVGFARFLHLLATFDFEGSPILVNFGKEFTAEDIGKIQDAFQNVRSNVDHKDNWSIFVATPREKEGSMWTRDQPSKQVE